MNAENIAKFGDLIAEFSKITGDKAKVSNHTQKPFKISVFEFIGDKFKAEFIRFDSTGDFDDDLQSEKCHSTGDFDDRDAQGEQIGNAHETTQGATAQNEQDRQKAGLNAYEVITHFLETKSYSEAFKTSFFKYVAKDRERAEKLAHNIGLLSQICNIFGSKNSEYNDAQILSEIDAIMKG
ncbi:MULTISPECIES: hypothetical protein [unclassified Campylobacter]|uniref:hypothetical protein n=1 Tax=unclassified Campylobacter TaxID=2593542 RepID=UPI0022E9F06C|nr:MULTISPECIES: hypothetical protein [unclassified Campylobacter]MDA3062706.1 hypothetical protein [Campylobacter sp. JMF_14 EL1]MDA3073993.1 hypothetical protein [Campylobacter sp. JMF_10 EL2]